MRRLVAIDPGTKMGWAIREERDGVMLPDMGGVRDLSFNRNREGPGMRILRARKFLQETISADTTLVVYEEVRRHMGTDAAHIYGALEGEIQAHCEANEIAYMAVPVGTVKKHATGRGNAGKDEMIKSAEGKWSDLVIFDDNMAYAMWIMEYTWETEMPEDIGG